MTDWGATPGQLPSRPAMLVIAAVLAAMGAIMLLHGLGVMPAAWLDPNPRVPNWVFALLGVILLLAAWLTLGKVRPMSGTGHKAAGLVILALSLIAMHWLVFFAQGGSCGIAGPVTLTNLSGSMCGMAMRAAVVLLDLILLLAGLATLRSNRRG